MSICVYEIHLIGGGETDILDTFSDRAEAELAVSRLVASGHFGQEDLRVSPMTVAASLDESHLAALIARCEADPKPVNGVDRVYLVGGAPLDEANAQPCHACRGALRAGELHVHDECVDALEYALSA